MDKSRLEYLFDQYFAKTGTDAERHELLDYLQAGEADDHDAEIHRLVTRAFSRAAAQPLLPPEAANRILTEILQGRARLAEPDDSVEPEDDTVPDTRPLRRLPWLRRATVAAALILLAGGYLWRDHSKTIQTPVTAHAPDIAPGGNKAVLTLAGGQRIILDSAANGMVAMQGNTQVQKQANGRLAYTVGVEGEVHHTVYNTLTTPRGGQYQLELPDGTQVWLNAASSITYPTAFTGGDRTVTITGEAYFEVKASDRQPFHVKTGDLDIAVLGTDFNINAYADEPALTTTLVAGKVKVIEGTAEQILIPGQQARAVRSAIRLIPHADMEEALAWKNGAFAFRDADFATVMRQLARWYDIDVQYTGPVPAGTFDGEIGRGLTLRQVLQGLARTRIHYTITGNHQILIQP